MLCHLFVPLHHVYDITAHYFHLFSAPATSTAPDPAPAKQYEIVTNVRRLTRSKMCSLLLARSWRILVWGLWAISGLTCIGVPAVWVLWLVETLHSAILDTSLHLTLHLMRMVTLY
jgi:hypothetical protein